MDGKIKRENSRVGDVFLGVDLGVRLASEGLNSERSVLAKEAGKVEGSDFRQRRKQIREGHQNRRQR